MRSGLLVMIMSSLDERRLAGFEQPRVRDEVFERADNAVANRELRRPAEAADAAAVEEDERAVADPSSFPARVRELRRNAEMLADPADGVVHFAVLVGPEVEDVDLVGRAVDGDQHRVDAILDVHVRLLLPAVAEDAERCRIAAKTRVEVEHVAVRIALAEDRDEAEDEPLEAEAFAVRLDQTLARHFRSAVERGLNRKRAV